MQGSDDDESGNPLLELFDHIEGQDEILAWDIRQYIADMEQLILASDGWVFGVNLLMKVYGSDERYPVTSFVRLVMERFYMMESAQQVEVAEFLLSLAPDRLALVNKEFREFVADVLTGERVSRVVSVLFLKIFLRFCDRRRLGEGIGDDEVLHGFVRDMWELAEEYDDDELTELLAEACDAAAGIDYQNLE